ncbi:MAG: hypothetical protein AB1345_06625 [Chloroflexota bacterium]
MTNYFEQVGAHADLIQKLLKKIPGFSGYFERQNRRDADKILRGTVASRFEELWREVSQLQREFVSQGELKSVDELEAAAIKLRTFTDMVRTASYGYSGFFDAVKINEEELKRLYEYDLALLDLVDEVRRAIDHVIASMGGEGLPASIRNLVNITRRCVDTFNRREEVLLS